MLHTIDSDTPFDMIILDFWETGDIPDWDVSRRITACLDCMTVFGIVSVSVLKEIKSDKVARCSFGNFFVPFGIPKIMVVDSDGLFLEFPGRISRRSY